MELNGICIYTNNVKSLTEFYEFVFDESSEGDEVHRSFDGMQLAIYNPGDIEVKKTKKLSLMYNVDDVDMEYGRIISSGKDIEVLNKPTAKPWGVKSFQFIDPDGNEISFMSAI